MEEVIEKLNGVWYLATTENDQPHVRPFDNAAMVNDSIYIGTANTKKVFDQIIKNPKIEIFSLTKEGPFRFVAKAKVEKDQKLAEEAFEKMEKPFNPETSVAIKLVNIKKY